VQQWKNRIDGEAKAQADLTTHLSNHEQRLATQTEFFRSRNLSWANKAHEARMWRDHLAQQKLQRCGSLVSKRTKQTDDFGTWYNRVLVETPKQLLQKRNETMSQTLTSSNWEVEKYHRATLGHPKPTPWFAKPLSA